MELLIYSIHCISWLLIEVLLSVTLLSCFLPQLEIVLRCVLETSVAHVLFELKF